VFPKWTNAFLPTLGAIVVMTPLYAIGLVWFGGSPKTTDIGYQPDQPVPFSHKRHAGELGIDCRYCHNTVEVAAKAAIPPTQTCMNCHTKIRPDDPRLQPLKASYETGMPVLWTRVHDLPDYAYFNHSAHVARGISCFSCHGRIDKMDVVYQQHTLSMGWCLECHRNPDPHLRERADVFNLAWAAETEEAQVSLARRLREEHSISPSTDCSTCHR
jgi:hypothetical protein